MVFEYLGVILRGAMGSNCGPELCSTHELLLYLAFSVFSPLFVFFFFWTHPAQGSLLRGLGEPYCCAGD